MKALTDFETGICFLVRVDGGVCGLMSGWVGWIDGWMNGWLGGWKY